MSDQEKLQPAQTSCRHPTRALPCCGPKIYCTELLKSIDLGAIDPIPLEFARNLAVDGGPVADPRAAHRALTRPFVAGRRVGFCAASACALQSEDGFRITSAKKCRPIVWRRHRRAR
jgi:hypothetical protein